MKISWELTEKSAKFIHHGQCDSDYSHDNDNDNDVYSWSQVDTKDTTPTK